MMSLCSGCVSVVLAATWLVNRVGIRSWLLRCARTGEHSINIDLDSLGSVLRIPVACSMFVAISPW